MGQRNRDSEVRPSWRLKLIEFGIFFALMLPAMWAWGPVGLVRGLVGSVFVSVATIFLIRWDETVLVGRALRDEIREELKRYE